MTYFTSGVYVVDTLENIQGCDSTATLYLSINNSSIDTLNVTACDSLDWNGLYFSDTGYVSRTFPDQNGCDSTVTINLNIIETTFSTVDSTVCDLISFNGNVYDTSGTYSVDTNTYSAPLTDAKRSVLAIKFKFLATKYSDSSASTIGDRRSFNS